MLSGAAALLRDIRPTIYIEVADRHVGEVTLLLREANYRLFAPADLEAEIETCVFNTVAIPNR